MSINRGNPLLWSRAWFLLLAVAVVQSLMQSLAAQASFHWLGDAVHPRGMALANAAVAAPNPSEALGLNPAGLVLGSSVAGSRPGLLVVLRRYPAGVSQQMTQIVFPLGRQMAGIEIRRMDYGTFAGYDDEGIPEPNYSAEDILVRGGLMLPVGRHLAVGAAGGGVIGNLAGEQSGALLWSLGARLIIPPLDAQVGAVLQNQGVMMNEFVSVDLPDQLPAMWLVGLAKSLAYLPVTLHLSAGRDLVSRQLLWRLGGEFRLARLVMRMGVDQGKTTYGRGNAIDDLFSGISLGLGTWSGGGGAGPAMSLQRTRRLRLDAAVKLLGPLGTSTSLALELTF